MAGLLCEDSFENLLGLIELLHPAQCNGSADVELEIVRLPIKDRLELLLSGGEILEVQSHSGQVLSGIHEFGVGGDRGLEHSDCSLDIVLLQVDETDEVENGGVVGVDAQRALADQIAHIELIFAVVSNRHVEIGVEIVRVPEQSDAAVLDSFVQVAFFQGFARVMVSCRCAVLVHGERLVDEPSCLFRLPAHCGNDSELSHGLRETGVSGEGFLEVLIGFIEVVEAQVEDAKIVYGLHQCGGSSRQSLEFNFHFRAGFQ